MSKLNKKLAIAAAAVAVVAIGGGTAYAYWSTTGSGSGTASTSAGASNLTITQTAAPTNLAPGVAAGAITGTVTNNATNSAYVNSVTVSIAGVTGPNITLSTPCDASDYTLANPTMSVATDLATGASANFSGASLAFNDKTTSNQDGCKSATVNLSYSSN